MTATTGSGRAGRIRAELLVAARSRFGRNATWFTVLLGCERLIAVAQTIIISRTLGITDYGIYGLVFGTIGFVASVTGLQMGLTSTVFVARYRVAERVKAAAVISMVNRFGWLVSLGFLALTLPFSAEISRALLGSAGYEFVIVLAAGSVASAVVSGVQDGVAQGFEAFGSLARIKLLSAALVLAAMFPVAKIFGLKGVLGATLGGTCVKFLVLKRTVAQCRRDGGIPSTGGGISFVELVSGFALPSMAVSLLVGLITWLGMWMLSRQARGLEAVAIVNTGMQWRGPLLLLAMSLSTVAVPAFSRYAAQEDVDGARRLRRALVMLGLAVSAAVVVALSLTSAVLLGLYGPGFAEGQVAFCLILASCVPMVLNQMYMQELVGAGRMWRVLSLHIPQAVAWVACLVILVPSHKGTGYAVSMLVAAVVLLGSVLMAERLEKQTLVRRAAATTGARDSVRA